MEDNDKNKIALKLITKTVIYSFAIFGVLFILILSGVAIMVTPKMKTLSFSENSILEIDFNDNYAESRKDDFFAEFTGASTHSVFDLIKAINIAASDNRIKALKANINVSSLGFAQIQDIVNAIKVFKSSGKKTYIYSSTMGYFGGGSKEYYLASAFDQIWLSPSAEIGITGVNIEVPFFNRVLQKLGIEPEFYSRYEYKTAVSSLISSEFTKEYKQELNKIGKGLYDQLIEGIVANRNLLPTDVADFINIAPLDADFALKNGLIDKIGYVQELKAFLQKEYNAKFIPINDYMSSMSDIEKNSIPLIVFMVLDGVIQDGVSSNSPINEAVIGTQSVFKQLEELRKKDNLKALVLRVNSPGGSYTASDEIRYAIESFKKEKNIPVIVSMSDYAASGGYFISLAADYIVAEPTTITGSIGVVGGKIVLSKLWEKLDINWGEISFGDNAGILSMNHKFTDAEKKIFEASLDRVYKDFTAKVMQTRNLNEEKIDTIARGRVWLGKDAFKLGLVDELGGIDVALLKARELAKLNQGERFSLIYYPRKQSFQEKLIKYIESGGGIPSVKIMEKYGISLDELKMLYNLRFDTVIPSFKVSM